MHTYLPAPLEAWPRHHPAPIPPLAIVLENDIQCIQTALYRIFIQTPEFVLHGLWARLPTRLAEMTMTALAMVGILTLHVDDIIMC